MRSSVPKYRCFNTPKWLQIPQKWLGTSPFGSGHSLGTLNHGLGPLFCCFITYFGAGGTLDPPGAPWTSWCPHDPWYVILGHSQVILGHYTTAPPNPNMCSWDILDFGHFCIWHPGSSFLIFSHPGLSKNIPHVWFIRLYSHYKWFSKNGGGGARAVCYFSEIHTFG